MNVMKILFNYRKGFLTLLCCLIVIVIKAQICMMCNEERLLRLINNNVNYRNYTINKCDDKPNCKEYSILHEDFIITLQLNTNTDRVELEFQHGSSTKGSTMLYNTFQRDMNNYNYTFVKNTPIGMEYNISNFAKCYVGFADRTNFVEVLYVLNN